MGCLYTNRTMSQRPSRKGLRYSLCLSLSHSVYVAIPYTMSYHVFEDNLFVVRGIGNATWPEFIILHWDQFVWMFMIGKRPIIPLAFLIKVNNGGNKFQMDIMAFGTVKNHSLNLIVFVCAFRKSAWPYNTHQHQQKMKRKKIEKKPFILFNLIQEIRYVYPVSTNST